MLVRTKLPRDQEWVERLLDDQWGDRTIIVHGASVDAASLPALIAGDNEGLATFAIDPDHQRAELVTLNAVSRGKGIGTALLEALVSELRKQCVQTLEVTTTNDNLDALRFYQRRGFRIVQVRCRAAEEARRIKPTLPLIGEHGIPVCDELVLVRALK